MPWNMNDYPESLKNLNQVTRKKAIDIANAMVDEGYDEGRAIPIATKQAEEWYENASDKELEKFMEQGDPTERSAEGKKYDSRPELMDNGEHIVPHEEGWAVQAKDAKQPSRVLDAKAEAVEHGKEIARNKRTGLIIHRKDGTVEEHISYE